jgi:hypothetical protein
VVIQCYFSYLSLYCSHLEIFPRLWSIRFLGYAIICRNGIICTIVYPRKIHRNADNSNLRVHYPLWPTLCIGFPLLSKWMESLSNHIFVFPYFTFDGVSAYREKECLTCHSISSIGFWFSLTFRWNLRGKDIYTTFAICPIVRTSLFVQITCLIGHVENFRWYWGLRSRW